MSNIQNTQFIADDTPIYERVTGPGVGGIATLVVDGKDVKSLLDGLFRGSRSLRNTQTGDLLFGRLCDASGALVDEVIVATLDAQASPTGNSQIELSCHGGEGVIAAVEEALRQVGISRGRGVELLARAHLNGKLSLIAIEARLRLTQATTARQAELLLNHKSFQQRLERLGFDMAMSLRTKKEKNEDYRQQLIQATRHELNCATTALALLARHHLVLCGPINAGKSTLANRLAGADRHLVSEIPGTTRDRLDTPLALRGLNLLLTDTAGASIARDEIEQESQQRAHAAAAAADLRLLVLDGSKNPNESDLEFVSHTSHFGPALLVLNKQDMGIASNARELRFLNGCEPVIVSACTGFGIDKLEEAIEMWALGGLAPDTSSAFTLRQINLLQCLHDDLKKGLTGTETLIYLRKLIGTRPDPEQLAAVFEEKKSNHSTQSHRVPIRGQAATQRRC
ncbi:MAG: GTPase [Planctomycetota bacterium]